LHEANFDEGAMWTVGFVPKEMTAAVEKQIAVLVKKLLS
jgi:hypothetical protein